MKPLIVIQARTGSTRLPNKMLLPFYGQECILSILLNRIRSVVDDSAIVVATTVSPKDDAIVECCERQGIKTFRGSESDVLRRFIDAAHTYKADKIIRVCADNVFIDTNALKSLYDEFGRNDYDYQSFCTSDGTPSIKTHYGFWAEAVKTSTLENVAQLSDDPLYHEHVTNFIYSSGHPFKIKFTHIEESIPGIEQHPHLRLTVDTPADFKTQQEIYAQLMAHQKEIAPQNIIDYLSTRNDLYDVMAKTISENLK